MRGSQKHLHDASGRSPAEGPGRSVNGNHRSFFRAGDGVGPTLHRYPPPWCERPLKPIRKARGGRSNAGGPMSEGGRENGRWFRASFDCFSTWDHLSGSTLSYDWELLTRDCYIVEELGWVVRAAERAEKALLARLGDSVSAQQPKATSQH